MNAAAPDAVSRGDDRSATALAADRDVRPMVDISATRGSALVDHLVAAGVSVAASLPDSWLSGVIDALDRAPGIVHVRLAREDDGAAVCAGAALAGARSVLVCQNAGVLLSANGLAAYALHHQLPFLVLAVARGGPDDGHFYQAYKGAVTTGVVQALGLPHHFLTSRAGDHLITEAMDQAWLHRRPVVVLCSRRALLGGDHDEAR
jgi:sulfopyruvate decarboxylase TPP-binding subunit